MIKSFFIPTNHNLVLCIAKQTTKLMNCTSVNGPHRVKQLQVCNSEKHVPLPPSLGFRFLGFSVFSFSFHATNTFFYIISTHMALAIQYVPLITL